MTDNQVELKLNDHEHEIKSIKHRVTDIEKKQGEIETLALSVNKLAINMEHMLNEQKEQGRRLQRLESEPAETAKYYRRTIVTAIITTFAGAIIGAVLALIIK